MPIFHDNLDGGSPPDEGGQPWEARQDPSRCMYEQARDRTDVRQRSPPESKEFAMTTNDGRPLSRGELIERIKRGESPTWTVRHGNKRMSPDATPPKASPRQSPTRLLPSVEFRCPAPTPLEPAQDNNAAGLEIQRPRSALHSGDFRPEKSTPVPQETIAERPLATPPDESWHDDFQPYFAASRSFEDDPPSRNRAISHSFSNILLMPPTSPLVQAVNNPDLDFSPRYIPARRKSKSPERENRRHTFSPHSFQAFQAQCFGTSTSPRPPPSLRREGSYPYQAHQPRRSITSTSQLQPNSTPQTPLLRPRRTSTSSEISPLVHASMVGSYEESILRGRMSTTPSKPLNFICQIGVLGKGKCKASLRCPPHAIVPFPAVFYSYDSSNGRISDNQPSPYVGLIDIENSLPHPEAAADESKRRRRYSPTPVSDRGEDYTSPHVSGNEDAHARHLRHKKERLRKRSKSPRAPPGGSYRIPQQGQLQIVIKNPNKTAVKLFLVPYDLTDMESGTKTFIRQRSYSAGPIIDMPLASRTNLGTDRPEASLSNSEDPNNRPTLRYLIHINICCTGKGRYYLYKSIRVVFANRVPDGKEKLRNEIQLPDPRYSVYKPVRDSAGSATTPSLNRLSMGATLSSEMAAKRRSTPYNPYVHMQQNIFATRHLDDMDGISSSASNPVSPMPTPWHLHSRTPSASSSFNLSRSTQVSNPPLRPIPFTLSGLEPLDSRPSSQDAMEVSPGSDTNGEGKSPTKASLFAKKFPPLSRQASPELRRENGKPMDANSAWLANGSDGRESPSLLARRLKAQAMGEEAP